MKWKAIATAIPVAGLLMSGCGGGSSTGVPAGRAEAAPKGHAAPPAEVASGTHRQRPEKTAHSKQTEQSSPPAHSAASARSKAEAPSADTHAQVPSDTPAPSKAPASGAEPTHKFHPAIEQLVGAGKPGGPGGAVPSSLQAEKVLRRLKEEASEDAKNHGDKEDGVERVLGELTRSDG
jgi:hypothetical protein